MGSWLIPHRLEWKRDQNSFPKRSVHKQLLAALHFTFPAGNPLMDDLRQLKRDRERADYEVGSSGLTRTDAEDAGDVAEEAIDKVLPAITDADMRRLANELFDLNRQIPKE